MPPSSFRSEMNGLLRQKIKEFWSVRDKGTGDFADKYFEQEDEEKLGE